MDFYPYIVNFFTQRDYERIPDIIKGGKDKLATDPKSFGERKKK